MSHYHRLAIRDVRPETRDAVVVTLAVPAHLRPLFRFTQGQHLNLRATIAGEEVRRSYSICSGVGDADLRVAIKRQLGGVFSTWANQALAPGAEIEAMPPAGLFHTALDPAAARRYLAIAAGSGITPVLSLIKTTLATEPRSAFTLFYGNRSSSAILFRQELSDLKDIYLDRLAVVHVMTREQQDLDLLNGRLSPEKVAAMLRFWGPLAEMHAVFLCGPHEMNRDLAAALESWGLPKARIKVEQFAASRQHRPLPVLAPPGEASSAACELLLDGHRYQFPVRRGQESILDAGLRAGLDLRYSCKGGVCATCRAKLVAGEVDMDGNFALEDYEIARGFILTCQSFPVSDQVVVDFDQD